MKSPIISIIVPNYNHERFLTQRLDSIFNQTFQDFEVVLLDDASTDSSLDILQNYANHEKVSYLIVNEKNSGSPFKQWKKGIELAKGEFIWIAESDDWAEHGFLESCLSVFSEHNYLNMVFCKSVIEDEIDNKSRHITDWFDIYAQGNYLSYSRELDAEFIKKHFHQFNCISNASAVLFRNDKKIFHDALIDAQLYFLMGDWLFWLAFVKTGKSYFLNKYMNHNRHHKKNVRTTVSFDESRKEGLEFLNYYYQTLKDLKISEIDFMNTYATFCFGYGYKLKKSKISLKNIIDYLKIFNRNSLTVLKNRIL